MLISLLYLFCLTFFIHFYTQLLIGYPFDLFWSGINLVLAHLPSPFWLLLLLRMRINLVLAHPCGFARPNSCSVFSRSEPCSVHSQQDHEGLWWKTMVLITFVPIGALFLSMMSTRCLTLCTASHKATVFVSFRLLSIPSGSSLHQHLLFGKKRFMLFLRQSLLVFLLHLCLALCSLLLLHHLLSELLVHFLQIAEAHRDEGFRFQLRVQSGCETEN